MELCVLEELNNPQSYWVVVRISEAGETHFKRLQCWLHLSVTFSSRHFKCWNGTLNMMPRKPLVTLIPGAHSNSSFFSACCTKFNLEVLTVSLYTQNNYRNVISTVCWEWSYNRINITLTSYWQWTYTRTLMEIHIHPLVRTENNNLWKSVYSSSDCGYISWVDYNFEANLLQG